MYHQVTVLQKEVTAASRELLLGSRAPLYQYVVEVMYWYNVTPKDSVSLVIAPTNAIDTYWVQAKGIYTVQSPDNDEVCRPYAVGDPVWMKPPNVPSGSNAGE